jgi:hypothetical protein
VVDKMILDAVENDCQFLFNAFLRNRSGLNRCAYIKERAWRE